MYVYKVFLLRILNVFFFVNDRFVPFLSQTYRLLEKHWRLIPQIYLVYIYIYGYEGEKKKVQ